MSHQEAIYRNILDSLYDGVYFVDSQRQITYWNRGAERITGYPAEYVQGRFCYDNLLEHVTDAGVQLCFAGCPLAQTIEDGKPREADVFLRHKSGHRLPIQVRVSPLRDETGQIIGAVEVFSDNSSMIATIKRMNELEEVASRDQLTGCLNRNYLEAKINLVLQENRQFHVPSALMFIDIDHFKQVNDTYGHQIGDVALQTVARTLRNSVRTSDYVGRWGGEEFVILLINLRPDKLMAVANKIRLLVGNSSIVSEEDPFKVTISVGATMLRGDDDLVRLVERADRLLYESKHSGRNRVTVDRQAA